MPAVKAVVYRGDGERPECLEVELAPPKAGEVEVEIVAAGVCHSDLHVVRGEWDVPTPVVLGHEGAGIVSAVGDGVDHLVAGDHVILSWVPNCGECRYCRAGRPAQCRVAATVTAPHGVLFDGTSRLSMDGQPLFHYLAVSSFAERAVVPASGAIKIRADAPLDTVALTGCAVATGVGAVQNTAAVPAGATVAVIGCGGVGLSCVQGARMAGAARIVAIDLVPHKLELAQRLGATDLIEGGQGAVERLHEVLPDGADFVFDAIGKIETTEQAIAALALGGAAVIVGLPPTGSVARFDPLVLAEADQKILGSNYGSVDAHRDIPALVDLYMDGELELDLLISGRRPLEEAPAALEELGRGQVLRQLLIP